MKKTIRNAFVGILLVALSAGNLINWDRVNQRNKVIKDREKLIFSYQSIINTILQSNNNLKVITKELMVKFDLDSIDNYVHLKEGEYLLIATPKVSTYKIDVSDFFGVTMLVNKNQEIEEIYQYKP